MPLTATVGEGAANTPHDVALVQAMLRVVNDSKGKPYLAGSYDGAFGPVTKAAILAFQTDNATTVQSGQPGKEKSGEVTTTGATFIALAAALPATHSGLRIIPGTRTVYLEASVAEAKASANAIRADAGFESSFRTRLAQLVDAMYAEHGIALKVTPTGRRRTFAQQAAETNTNAGPGESNHNFGRASDIGFKGLRWLKGDGTIKVDDDWLNGLNQTGSAKAGAMWDARDALARKLPLYRLGFERVHLQLYDQATFSNIASLVQLLNKVGACKWASVPGSKYQCDLGLGGALYGVGTARQIWSLQSPVTAADIAAAMTVSEAKKSKATYAAADITTAQLTAMKKLLKDDFMTADANWSQWAKAS